MGVFGIRLVTQIALLFLLARFLGPADFGEYVAIAALAVLLGALSSLGIGFLVLVDTSKDAKSGLQTYRKALPITLVSASFLLPLYLVISHSVIHTAAETQVLVMLALSELVIMPLVMVQAKRLQGLDQTAKGQLLLTSPLVARLLLLAPVAYLFPNEGLAVFVCIHIATSIMALGIGIALCGGVLIDGNRLMPPDFTTARTSLPYAFMRLASLGPGEIDKTLAPRLLGSNEAGAYSLAARGMAVAVLPVIALMLVIQPRILSRSTPSVINIRTLLGVLLTTTIAYGIVIGVLLSTIAPSVFLLVLGQQFASSAEILQLLALVAPLLALRVALGGLLVAFEMPRSRTLTEAIGTVVLLVSAILAAPALAAAGFVLAIAISELFMVLAFSGTLILRKQLESGSPREA